MRRILLAAAPLAILLGAACGDGEDKPDDATTSPEAVLTQDSNEQPQVPDTAMPTPTPLADADPVLQVVAMGQAYTPTRGDFGGLAKTKIDAGGKSYEGVTLAALAEKAGAPQAGFVTIQGTRSDNLRFGAVRFAMSEIGTNTVLLLDESGHVSFASAGVPPEQWLKDISGIALN
jgi:hypothetical protein